MHHRLKVCAIPSRHQRFLADRKASAWVRDRVQLAACDQVLELRLTRVKQLRCLAAGEHLHLTITLAAECPMGRDGKVDSSLPGRGYLELGGSFHNRLSADGLCYITAPE